MEEQPNSHMFFVCGIENHIGPKLSFYTDDGDRCIRAILDNCTTA